MRNKVDKDYWSVIWARFKTGDQESFASLYNLHINHLYQYGTKLCKDEDVVKDAIQELFIELFLKREKIKIAPENLKYYLFLALKRCLIKKLQKGRKIIHAFNESVDFEPEYCIEYQIMEEEKDKEINRKVSNALNQLPAKQKEAVYLRFNQGLEYDEIAEILEITVESVRKQVYRALKTVRETINNESLVILFSVMAKKV